MLNVATDFSPVPTRLLHNAGRFAALPALIDGDMLLTHADLHDQAARLAAALTKQVQGADPVIAVCLPRTAAQVVALYAAWMAGAAYLPLDPAWPAARLEAMVARVGASAVVCDAAMASVFDRVAPVVAPGAGQELAPLSPAPVCLDDLAYVIFTSGSTGDPKAVEITHGNLASLVDWHEAAFDVGPGTRMSHLAGLGFDAAAWEVWPVLAVGGTLVLADEATRLDAGALQRWLVAERIDIAFAPTALAEPLVGMAWPKGTALRVLLTGADKLTRRPRPNLPFSFVNNYGPTECTVVATSGPVASEGEGLPSIGQPIAGTQIHLLDPAGEPVAPGAAGEIWIGGAQVGRGYRDDADATALRFIDHPDHGRLYRTGDLAHWTAAGELAFLGRVDRQVKIRGHRVEPAEVAAALHLVDDVSQSVVVAGVGELIAYVVPAHPAVTATGLRAALGEMLPDYMIPARFAALDALPLTANGKVDVKALPDPATCRLGEAQTGRAPATPTEQRLFAIVADVIGRRDFGVEDDFFLLGGHSLLGTQVIIRARDAFGVELTLFHLFEGRTVAALAERVEQLVIERIEGLSDEEIRRLAAG
ncbi:MAG: non-ribosomal peptide synthetase [Sphingomonas sp.]